MTSAPDPSLAEIRGLIERLPAWPDGAAARAPRPLGVLDALAEWIGAGTGRIPPRLERPRAALFLGRWEASGDADDAARKALESLRAGRSRVNALCRAYDAELRVFEMAIGEVGSLTDRHCAAAMAYGMTAADEGIDLLCLAALGPGAGAASARLAAALGEAGADPLAALARHGGHALAALAGAVVAARVGRVPVVLDGAAALAAAAALHAIDPAALDHCVLAQEPEAAWGRSLKRRLGKEAVLDLGIAAEDGSAALLVLGLLRGALAPVEPRVEP